VSLSSLHFFLQLVGIEIFLESFQCFAVTLVDDQYVHEEVDNLAKQ